MEAGQVKHEIAAHFGLDQIVQAHEAVEQGSVIGKVIVTP
jgi:NADPH:quinone reductase-like Zn-dependent oxidoreductase